MGRAPCCDKANVKRGPWSPEEDVKLKTYIEEYGTGGNWIALPHKIGLKRCGKSCRLRWLNYLRPNIKHGGFSEEEDSLICNLYISIGSRWSVIAAQLPGRTDNDIKNYWNTRLKKKLLGRRKDSQSRRGSSNQEQSKVKKDAMDSAGNTSSQSLSASAVERMQLYIQLQGLNTPLSFYNNPAIWPKFIHPLGDHGNFQTHQSQNQHLPTDDPHLHQIPIQTTTPEPLPDMPIPSNQIDGGKTSNTAQEFDVNSLNGFPSESNCTILTNGEMNDNFGSAAARLQEELSELFYGDNDGNLKQVQVCQQQQQEKLTINQDIDCSKGIESAGYDNMNISWWANNDISQKSSSTSWDSNAIDHLPTESIFQDFNWGSMSYI